MLHIVDSQRHINNSLPQSRINGVAIFMLYHDMDTLLGLCQQLRFEGERKSEPWTSPLEKSRGASWDTRLLARHWTIGKV